MDKPLVSDLNLKLGLQAVMDSVEFVETPQPDSNRIRCAHCKETTVYFHAGECEHKPIVCSTCYEQSGIKTCRDCEQAVQDACREDSQILDSVAYCRLKKDGCDAVLPLRNILHHEDECHPSVIPVNQVANNTAKRMDSAGSLKQQAKEDDGDLRKLVEDLRRKFSEYEKGRVVEKLTNQLALMEEKLNREVAAKKDMERRLLDQTKRKTEVIKQELLRHITDQLSQQVDRQVKESEIKVQGQTAAGLEKLKHDVIKTITAQVSKQVERQVQESSRKITEQLEPKTAAEMRRMARNVTERMGQSLERQLMDSERKILEKVSKKADAHKKELSKNISEQVSQQTEKKMRMTEAGRKAEPTKVVKDNKSLQVEKKTNENNATKEVRKSRKMSSDSNHDEDKTVHRAEDATDGRRREQFTKLSKELEAKVHSQGLEARNNVMAKLQETSRDLERSLLEQVALAAEKHSQGIQKRCEALVAEQVRKGMADVKDLVAKGVELELGRQAAELQKASAKELKAQRQQLEQANQQLADHLSGAQAGAAAEMRKAAERDREDLQRMAEAKTALLVKNHAAELQKRMLEELKALRQEVTAAGQKHIAQLQDSHDTKIKILEKKNEADRDRLQRAVDERLAQQAKVSETELHKRIVKELGLQKLEMARENQQLVAQLHDDQGAALRHLKQQADVDKEKWTKYLEERLGQQVNAGLGALARQATLDKQELLQTYMQLVGLQEARPGKRSEAFKQGLVADVSNQMFEKLDKRMTALQQEMDTTKAREEITRYVDQKVQDAQEELQQVVQSAVKGIELFEKDPAGAAGNTAVDGAVSNGPAAHEREDFKRAIISEIESNLLEKLQGAMNGRCERCSPDKVSAVNGAVINGPTALEQEDFKKAIISEIENNVLDKLQGATNGRCDRCSFEPARGSDDGHVNGKDDGPVQNSAANGDHGEQGRSLQDMSHFEHFEAMQRKIFNKQFGKLVNEAHAKIMAVVNELSVPKREEMVTEVALRVNERLEDIQKILLNRLDQEILMQKQEVLRCLEERLGQAMKQNSAGDAEPDTQTTFMKEWHEENSRLIPMPQGKGHNRQS